MGFFTVTSQANVVTWNAEVVESAAGQTEIRIVAELERGWKLYSQFTDEGGPLPTQFSFDHPESVQLIGGVTESSSFKKEYSELFELNVTSAEGRVEFSQILTHDMQLEEQLKIEIKYMSCDGEKCIPPTTESILMKI